MIVRPEPEHHHQNGHSNDEVSILEIAGALWQERRIIFLAVVVSLAVAVMAALMLPRRFTAATSILPTAEESLAGGLSARVAAQLGPAGSMLGVLPSSKTADLVDILESRSLADRVITTCRLESQLKGWDTRDGLRRQVQKMVVVHLPKPNRQAIEIEVQAPSGRLASDMANAWVDALKFQLDAIGYGKASRKRNLIERQLEQVRKKLGEAERRVGDYQAKNPMATLPEALVSSMRVVSELESQRVTTQAALRSAETSAGVVRSHVSALRADPNSLMQLEIKRESLLAQEEALSKATRELRERMSRLPPQALAFARLEQEFHIQSAIFLALSQQYQTAILTANEESEAFIVLDRASIPPRPSHPRRLMVFSAGLLVGIIGGVLIASLKRQIAPGRAGSALQGASATGQAAAVGASAERDIR